MIDPITNYLFTTLIDRIAARQKVLTKKVERGLRRPVTLVHLVRTGPDGYKYPLLIDTAGESEAVKAHAEYQAWVEDLPDPGVWEPFKPLGPPRPPGPWERWEMIEPLDVIATTTPIPEEDSAITEEKLKQMAEDLKIRYPNQFNNHVIPASSDYDGLRAWADSCPYYNEPPKPNDKD